MGVLPSLTAAVHFPAGFSMHTLQQELVPVFSVGELGKETRGMVRISPNWNSLFAPLL